MTSPPPTVLTRPSMADMEKRITALEEAMSAKTKTDTWVRYRVMDLLKLGGLRPPRTPQVTGSS